MLSAQLQANMSHYKILHAYLYEGICTFATLKCYSNIMRKKAQLKFSYDFPLIGY